MTEPDVTLTDYGLAVECAVLSYLLWFAVFFRVGGPAALTGGTVRGFFLDAETWGARILWPVTLLAIGVSALAARAIGAKIQLSEPAARWVTSAAAVEFAGYGAIVLLVTRRFTIT